MESIEAERPTPQPLRPAMYLSDSEIEATTRQGSPTQAAPGDNSDLSKPGASAVVSSTAATKAADAEVMDGGADVQGAPAQVERDGEGVGGNDIGELPGLPDFPSDDLAFDDDAAPHPVSGPADDGFDLAPLPTEFDPDAPLPDLPPTAFPEDDELAIVHREEEPEPAPEPEPPAPSLAEETPAESAPSTEQEQEFFALIRGLQEPGADGDAEGATRTGAEDGSDEQQSAAHDRAMEVDELPEAGASSPAPSSPLTPLPPLSPVPELPTELDLDDNIPLARFPSSVLAPELQTYSAESSSAALHRARVLHSASPHPDDLRRRSPGRSEDRDELGSDGNEKRERYKRRKGLDGKLIRASAKPRKRIDKQLQIERHGQKPPEKVAPRAKTLSEMRLKAMVRGKTRETQLAPCIRPRYGKWGKCTQCVSKIGGDSCRFRNYRIFPLNPETAEIIGPGWFESTKLEQPLTMTNTTFNTTLTDEHISRTEKTVAPLLVGIISKEMRHVVKNKALHRPIDTAQHRSVCDFCSSTIFAGFWFCTKCGRDYCIDCERFFSDSMASINTSPWPVPDATRPRLHRCTRGDEQLPLPDKPQRGGGKLKQVMHFRGDLMAASRLSATELRADFLALINFVLEPGSSDMDIEARIASLNLGDEETDLANVVRGYLSTASSSLPPTKSPLSDEQIQSLYDASKTLPQAPDPTAIPPLPFMFIDGDRLDCLSGAFDALWARGEPIVADNLLKRLKRQWTPDNFLRRFKAEQCYVVDCQTEKVQMTSVGAFFLLFKELGGEVSAPKPPANGAVTGSPVTSAASTPGGANSAASITEVDVPATSSEHQPVRIANDQRPREPSETPAEGANGVTGRPPASNEPPLTVAANGNGTTSIPPLSTSPSQPPPTSATARPILPAPAGEGSSGSGAGTPRRLFTFEEQVAQMTSWAPGYAKLKAAQKIFKLKDWPSTDDFASAYPDLYEDFSQALPAGDFTQRIGVLNLYSHFPPGPTRPDIGPKMYNALAGREDPKGNGTTRLHMDVADAVNIMLYASKRPDGSPGCAVWDIFRAEDADKIRAFLRAKNPHAKMTDPIHSQLFFLNAQLRTELYTQYGVSSFRVYQYPGQAVFVPAGCAHQVCNLANCMKIALDFVSPHNVRRCQQLMQDFRKENYAIVWKEDVLQLYNVLWYAWTNVRSIRERRKRQAIQDREHEARRAEYFARLRAGHVAAPRGPLPPYPGIPPRPYQYPGVHGHSRAQPQPHHYPQSYPHRAPPPLAHPHHPPPHPHHHEPHPQAASNTRSEPRSYPFAPAMSSVRDDRSSPGSLPGGSTSQGSSPVPAPTPAGFGGVTGTPPASFEVRIGAERISRHTTPADSGDATPGSATSAPRTTPPAAASVTSSPAPAATTVASSDPAPRSTGEPRATSKDTDSTDRRGSGTTDAIPASQERTITAGDKDPESASASARQIPATNGTVVPPPSQTLITASPPLSPPASPRQTLAERLLQAALDREPKPELHVEPTPKQPTPPPPPTYSLGHEPLRYTDSFRLGHLPADLMEDVMRSEMGGFDEDVDMLR